MWVYIYIGVFMYIAVEDRGRGKIEKEMGLRRESPIHKCETTLSFVHALLTVWCEVSSYMYWFPMAGDYSKL